MNLITRIRHKLGKMLWSENEWTKAVDDIEKAAKEISTGKKSSVVLRWQFRFMKPPNKFWIKIEADANPVL